MFVGERHDQCILAMFRINVTPVTERLFDIMLMFFDCNPCKSLYYSKIGNAGQVVCFDNSLQKVLINFPNLSFLFKPQNR